MGIVIEKLSFKELIPLISAIVIIAGWLATYYFNLKLKTREAFMTKTEEDLKNILCQMSVEIRNIWEESHKESHERKLQAFYCKYRAANSPLNISTISLVIEHFNQFQIHYKEYANERTNEKHDNVYTALAILEKTVNSKLKQYRGVLFKYYNWYYQREKLNPVIRLIAEVSRLFYQTLTGLAIISAVLIFLTFFELGESMFFLKILKTEFPIYFWPNRYYILTIAISLILLWIVGYCVKTMVRATFSESVGSSQYSYQQIEHNKKFRQYPTFVTKDLNLNEDLDNKQNRD